MFPPPPRFTATRSAKTSTTARHTCAAGARPGATASCTRTVRRRSSTWVHSSCSTAHAHTTILVANYEVMIAQDIENWFSFWLLAYYLQDGDIDYTMMGRDVCMGDHKVPSALSVTSLARRVFDVKNIHVPPTAYSVHNTYRVTWTCTVHDLHVRVSWITWCSVLQSEATILLFIARFWRKAIDAMFVSGYDWALLWVHCSNHD